MNRTYLIYLMASKSGTLYIGVTNDLIRRVIEHKQGNLAGFTKKYNCNKLIYYEQYDDIRYAISREKEIKNGAERKRLNYSNPQIQAGEICLRICCNKFERDFSSLC